MTTYFDFHLHSAYSDGLLRPEQVVMAVKLRGLDAIALTDHDNLDGLEEARKTAETWGINFIPGIEFTAGKYHILGLGFDYRDKELQNLVDESKKLQEDLTMKRVVALQGIGMPITFEKVRRLFPVSRLGKYNLFMTLMHDVDCRRFMFETRNVSPRDLMRYFLSSNEGKNPAYVPGNEGLDAYKVIQAIKKAGGISVIAHPAKDVKDFSELDLLREFGLDGLEVQPNDCKNNYQPFEEYARMHGMFITYGSDYHGPDLDKPILSRDRNILSNELERRLLK